MNRPRVSRSFEVVADLPAALSKINELAANLRWTWNSDAIEVFRSADKDLWEQTEHNPIQLISRLSPQRAEKLANDVSFLQRLEGCVSELREYLAAPNWFDQAFPGMREQTTIAYFCAEFGLFESIPIYSGGLGILAGDHLKAASDLGLPLVGVGLLYSKGFFRQRLNHDGWQQEVYPQYDFYQTPLRLVRGSDGSPLRIEVELPDRLIKCQVWRADVGRITLYLLDSNVLDNSATDQAITDTLYGGDEEMRIRQEMILGVGGMRALQAMGISPTVCHMNEGHAAFLGIERVRQYMQAHGCDFRTARQVAVAGNVFTTHTPVPAGFDLFTPDLLRKYISKTLEQAGIPFDEFIRTGRIDPADESEPFNMAVLAMGNADYVNGVSKLHAAVSRSMFQERWPGYLEEEIPISAVTNGIHTTTWTGRRMGELLDEYLGRDWRSDSGNPEVWKRVYDIPDEELWNVRENERGNFVRYVRKKIEADMVRRGQGRADFNVVGQVLDPRVLTVGFARRFATYKRASLMLTDRDRLKGILFHPERPLQIVIAGKSHPRDDGGKKLIQELIKFIEEEGGRTRMAFLEDYDISVARAMVQGVDVWLNNPRRPMEASGTSGMKVVPNGGLNCSILDGWWDEGYSPEVGFSIGDRTEVTNPEQQDWQDAQSLYSLLENEVTARFYNRSEGGVPREWVQMMKASIAQLSPVFSTSRMVADYATQSYMPAARACLSLSENGEQRARAALEWRDRIQKAWSAVAIQHVDDDAGLQNALGREFRVNVRVELGDLSPEDVSVQVVIGRIGGNRDLIESRCVELDAISKDGTVGAFSGCITLDRAGHQGYSVRALPKNADVNVPAELRLVTWQPGAL